MLEPAGPNWPTMTPPDLRTVLDGALSVRNVEAADIWTNVRERLIKHGAEAPEGLPIDRSRGEQQRD